jgi:hypothetical protein
VTKFWPFRVRVSLGFIAHSGSDRRLSRSRCELLKSRQEREVLGLPSAGQLGQRAAVSARGELGSSGVPAEVSGRPARCPSLPDPRRVRKPKEIAWAMSWLALQV